MVIAQVVKMATQGKWIGGSPVLGYDVADKRLVVNQQDAEQVRQVSRRIFCERMPGVARVFARTPPFRCSNPAQGIEVAFP